MREGDAILPRSATNTTIRMMAISAPWETWKFPLLLPDAPASLSGLPSEPAFAVPAVLSLPPVYGSLVASGKLDDDVAAMIVKGTRQRPQVSRFEKPSQTGDATRRCSSTLRAEGNVEVRLEGTAVEGTWRGSRARIRPDIVSQGAEPLYLDT